ncbi:hypothetical protein [Paeniclostridium hominis]|uniref:hypothetical protein n=1 Tax=Paeniclostridium hominis TaxID=2764329 RepID=UPI0022E654F0|nr:hypothetical protein [Paeniclostridium hominis]
MNKKQTGKDMSRKASEILRNDNSSAIQKRLAASLVSQSNSRKQTGKAMETTASKVLKSDKYNSDTKALAASVLSQSNKLR